MKGIVIIFTLICSICAIGAISHPAYAIDSFSKVCNSGSARNSTLCKSKTNKNPLAGDDGILIKITNIIAYVAGAVAVIMIIVAGIKYITANGDANSIGSAKGTIISALIGLVVIVLARTLINFVVGKL